MNHVNENDDDFSGWDSLASELGLPPEPAKPVPESPPKAPPPVQTRVEPPAPLVETVELIPAHVAEFELKVTSVSDVVEPEAFGEPEAAAEEVLEDALDVFDDEGPEPTAGSEAAAEGEGKGRRRRRRRRRKKGSGEPAETPDASAEPAADVEAEIAFPDPDAVQAVEEIAESESDDEESEVEVIEPAIPEDDLDEDGAAPLPEWKVMAWTDLVATLYRPQDR